MRPQKKPRYNDWYTPPGKKRMMAILPDKTQRAMDLACEKGASN